MKRIIYMFKSKNKSQIFNFLFSLIMLMLLIIAMCKSYGTADFYFLGIASLIVLCWLISTIYSTPTKEDEDNIVIKYDNDSIYVKYYENEFNVPRSNLGASSFSTDINRS